MKKISFLFVTLFLCFIPNNIKAYCTSSDKAKLKKIVSNVNISYDYEIVNYKAKFKITFNNLTPDIYFKDPYGNIYRTYDLENNEVVLYNYSDGNSYAFNFYGANSCGSEKISTLYVTTPTYNPYYQYSVCDNAREYELCQRWASHSLSRSEFIKSVKEYKEKNGIIDDTDIKKDISYIDFTISFIKMYGLYILGGIVIVIITVKIIRYKKDSFGF